MKKQLARKRQKSNRIKWLLVGIIAMLGAVVVWKSTRNDFFVRAEPVGKLAVPAVIDNRDGGGTARLGDKIVWLFGDTFYHPQGKNLAAPDVWRSTTSLYTDPAAPFTSIQQPVDGAGNPPQVIPLTAEETAYNRARNNPQDRYVVWPTGQVALDANTVLIYFQRFLTTQDKSSSTGVAILKTGQDVATRLPALFGESDPQFRKAMVKDDYVYVYAAECPKLCPVARAPLAHATERSAYSFWDGKTWSADIAKAQGVITSSNYGFDVMWNSKIKRYTQVMIGNLSHQAYLSYAKNPQGPWSTPAKAFTLTGKSTYVPYFHSELGNEAAVYMTYSSDGAINVVRLTFH